jgi:hypothetical protein
MHKALPIAVAEKLAMLEAETFFTERAARAALTAFDQLMQRKTGEPPREDDQI